MTGCEALLRWRHPVRGMISPADFVPVAEETGLIEEIGLWVLRTDCIEAAGWPANVRVAVNVSPVQFKSETLALKVARVLAESGLDPRRLELEISEAVLIADDDAALVTLGQLRALGVHIALDELRNRVLVAAISATLPVRQDQDRPQLRQGSDPQHQLGLDHPRVVSIAADRNMITTAEGVETDQQRDTVQMLGCTQMQGYLFSRPVPAKDVRTLLAADGVEDAA
ncbi:EAL domain-containing protein [Bradyrhizobium genosp. P]